MATPAPADLRHSKSLEFLQAHISTPARVLDLGVRNALSDHMRTVGYEVENTGGEDLDEDYSMVEKETFDVVTSFEIFEHLLSPYPLLKSIQAPALIGSVPLSVWFAPAYRHRTDPRDRHFHEFESWQFDWLLEKTGWRVAHSFSWRSPDKIRLGYRPLLRLIWPSYYFFHCVR